MDLVGSHAWRLLDEYRFEPTTGLWQHSSGPIDPPLRLTDVAYAADGSMTYPHDERRAPVSELPGYLAQARRILADARPSTPAPTSDRPTDPPACCPAMTDPGLNWFELPAR